MDLVCVNPSSSSSWVWVECFFWYQLIRVVPDKWLLNGSVCVCEQVVVAIQLQLTMKLKALFLESLEFNVMNYDEMKL